MFTFRVLNRFLNNALGYYKDRLSVSALIYMWERCGVLSLATIFCYNRSSATIISNDTTGCSPEHETEFRHQVSKLEAVGWIYVSVSPSGD